MSTAWRPGDVVRHLSDGVEVARNVVFARTWEPSNNSGFWLIWLGDPEEHIHPQSQTDWEYDGWRLVQEEQR